ncbi:MAG TPA: class I SAM-dependent methyltransferase [Candidatus Limnocylindrales bacterium]|nr:class I SAM-dependent methyltransferase [Candidatus Limnocylindrales bacterium]
MQLDDRFDDMVASLGGFYRTWYVVTGLELGLFARLREAGQAGLAADELARRTGTDAALVGRWAWGAAAHDLVEVADDRLVLDGDVATILLDADRPEYLGGQFLHAAIGSLDFADFAQVFRTGVPLASRPDRYRQAIERLTAQDVAVFFQEVLPANPQLVVDLQPGCRILDIHCGGGRWLVAMARRFPGTRLTGIEFEADSVARARAAVETAVLGDRVTIEQGDVASVGHAGEATLAYFQYALHQLLDPVGALRSAWATLLPGGWLVALDWYLPSDPDEMRTRHSELIAGVQLDELIGGTRLVTRSEALGWFADAAITTPELIDLPSGATVVIARR